MRWQFTSPSNKSFICPLKKVPWRFWGLLLATTIYGHDHYFMEFIKLEFYSNHLKFFSSGLSRYNLHTVKFQMSTFQVSTSINFEKHINSHETTSTICHNSSLPQPKSLASIHLFSVLIFFAFSSMAYKWNHIKNMENFKHFFKDF